MARKKWGHKKRALRFKAQNGLCHWCRLPMVLIDDFSPYKKLKANPVPPNACTLDHVYEVNDPMRQKNREADGKLYQNVAACYSCNNARSSPVRRMTAYWGA